MAVRTNTVADKESIKSEIKNIILKSDKNFSKSDIKEIIYYKTRNEIVSVNMIRELSEEIYNTIYMLGKIQKYLDDPDINEIMINGLDNIIVEKNSKIFVTKDKFESEEELNNIIQRMASDINKRVNMNSPIVDLRLLDGSRVNVVLKPIALNGPIVTIRKFKEKRFTLDHYQELNIIDEELKDFIISLVKSKYNIFISGGTSSGKTTFLNALCEHINKNERVVTIEDSAELKVDFIKNLVRLETRSKTLLGDGEISIRDLIKTSLRMRPDRIIVGEVRGIEAVDMLNAMNTGHDGSISTGHGNSSYDMLNRLELMVLRDIEIPIIAVKKLISSSIDILIHLKRDQSNRRYIESVNELGFKNDNYDIKALYKTENGRIKKVNEIKNNRKLKEYGYC